MHYNAEVFRDLCGMLGYAGETDTYEKVRGLPAKFRNTLKEKYPSESNDKITKMVSITINK